MGRAVKRPLPRNLDASLPPDPGASAVGDLEKAQFDALYKEIADNSTRVFTVFSLCTTAVTAYLGFFLNSLPSAPIGEPTFAEPTPFVVLIVTCLVIFSCILLVDSSLNSTVRIAGYLAALESKATFSWQGDIQRYRENKRGRRFGVGMRSIFDALSTVVFVSAAWTAWRVWPHTLCAPVPWVFILLLLAFAFLFLWLRARLKVTWSSERFEESHKAWKAIFDHR